MTLEEVKQIVKWDNKYKGNGIRIALIEQNLNGDHVKNIHQEVFKELLPEAEIFIMDSNKDSTFKWISENNIHLVSMSMSDNSANIYPATKTSFLVTSAGNDGPKGETMRRSRAKDWFQVGALKFKDNNISLMNYSSWKYDKVDGAMFSGIETSKGILHGTSYSAPIYVCLLAQYYEAHNEFFSKYPTIAQTVDFIDRHSHNVLLFDRDADLKIGYGLLVLPEEYHFEEVTLKFNTDTWTSYESVIKKSDGAITTEKLLEPAFIKDGRTYLGLRDMANIKGNFIRWDNDKKEVQLFVQQGDH